MSDLINRSHLIDDLIIAEAIQRVNGDEATAKAVAITIKIVEKAPTIDPESLKPKGRWVWKRRHRGGFHKYTGVDSLGETHTITVDERFECDEPYCPKCGKWNESMYLNYCPNCGAKMMEV